MPTVLLSACASLPVFFFAWIKGGTVLRGWFGIAVQHLKRSERETGFCSLWLQNRELLVSLERGKTLFLGKLYSAEPEKQ